MHLISYDIQHDGLRTKVAKTLIQYGLLRIQYSVFMGEVKNAVMRRLEKEIQALHQLTQWTPDDSIMVLPLHQYSEDHVFFVGKEPDRWQEISGELHTLML